MLDIGGFVFDGMGYASDLLVGIRIAAFFDSLARSGQGLGVIAGVPAGSVDQMLHPGPARKALWVGELSLGLGEFFIESLQGCGGECLAACLGAGFAVVRCSLVQREQCIVERRKVEERRYLQCRRRDHGMLWDRW